MKKQRSSGKWPATRWISLFSRATALIEASCPGAYWTFGGGTALALRYEHRISYDVDIYLRDVQLLSHLTPRLNEFAASISGSYDESANGLKIVTENGDIDFLVAGDVTDIEPETIRIHGTKTLVQVPAEILAKNIQYRGYQFMLRDIFDLSMLMERDSEQVRLAIEACTQEAVATTARLIVSHLPRLRSELPNYVNPTKKYVGLIDRAPDIVLECPEVRKLMLQRKKKSR